MQNGTQLNNNYIGWDIVFEQFLKSAGLEQTLKGFRNDMIVMNHDWESEEVYPALHKMASDLKDLFQNGQSPQAITKEESKLDWISFADNATPSTPSQLNRTISQFIAQNRAKNNLSNRNEFLRKRRRITTVISESDATTVEVDAPTCARTDAIPINRDAQIKYDIAKNEHGPLARTLKLEQGHSEETYHHHQLNNDTAEALTPESDQRHSGILERFSNLEEHLAVRHVPSPPVSLLDRIRFLEQHIIRLEKDYPPWAALHFKQPNRGWPPPPRATPLIIPTHLTAASNLAPEVSGSGVATTAAQGSSHTALPRSSGNSKPSKKKSSSLHRAVLEKLEVKRALAGED